MSTPLKVFCCYAHEDEEMLTHLRRHLIPLQRRGLITIWSDTDLNAGVEREKELHWHLEHADIILLLISPYFMASDYCYGVQMKRAIQRHHQGSAYVIPILIRATLWQNSPFAELQMVPTNAEPVTSWPDLDEAFRDIAEQINRVITGPKIIAEQRSEPLPLHRFSQKRRNILVGGGIFAALLTAGGIGFRFLSSSFQTNGRLSATTSVPQTPPSVQTTPKDTVTSINSVVPPNTLLYSANWSNGLGGWVGPKEWKASGGMLLSDGTDTGGNDVGLITCPFNPSVANYAVEAVIQMTLQSVSGEYADMGIFVRGDGNGNGYWLGDSTFSVILVYYSNDQGRRPTIKTVPYTPDSISHTWRVEAKDNVLTVFLDNIKKLSVTDNHYITGSQIGLFTLNNEIRVQSFKVYSL